MTSKFKVGDVVIGVGFLWATEYNGVEATIVVDEGVGPTHGADGVDYGDNHTYKVVWQGVMVDPDNTSVAQENLKLKKPDSYSGEESVLSLFKVGSNKYNFDFHEDIVKEMAEEDVVEVETV